MVITLDDLFNIRCYLVMHHIDDVFIWINGFRFEGYLFINHMLFIKIIVDRVIV